jgi:hypothetical protein
MSDAKPCSKCNNDTLHVERDVSDNIAESSKAFGSLPIDLLRMRCGALWSGAKRAVPRFLHSNRKPSSLRHTFVSGFLLVELDVTIVRERIRITCVD